MTLPEGQPATTSPRSDSKDNQLCVVVIPKTGLKMQADLVRFPMYWFKLPGQDDSGNSKQDWEDNPAFPLGPILEEVLADSLLEDVWFSTGTNRKSWVDRFKSGGWRWFAERQFLPGVTDNLARTVEEALHLKGQKGVLVASGTGYLFTGSLATTERSIEDDGRYKLFHPLTDRFKVHDLQGLFSRPLTFPGVAAAEAAAPAVVSLALSDSELIELSRNRLLALSLEEMKAIRAHFEKPDTRSKRKEEGLPEWPLDVEIEVIAQTWSEHCKHKIFNASIIHEKSGKKSEITSLFKTCIAAPTRELMASRDDLLSVFVDNSGVVRWNRDWAVCFKVETHNSPSALEPYGGALTGILGVNRDVLGTGLGARPIFNTDVLCFAFPSALLPRRPKLLPPEAIMAGVRQGIQDGGNKSGIPTVNGAVTFHPGFRAKPLVFCGTGGILPVEVNGVKGYEKHTRAGDTIIVAGGRVGKDGIHGATFSSEALNELSPVSAVQIGDPFTQKRLTDFVLAARDAGLITGITDNGAGGLSSSVGEMATITGGATMVLDHVPLKYPGLCDYEIVISESQERMTISTSKAQELMALAEKFSVECTEIGNFTTDGYFRIKHNEKTVALLPLEFLHEGAPRMKLESQARPYKRRDTPGPQTSDLEGLLLALLWHENVCSRESVIRQYDHEVQGASVVKPLMGGKQCAPCDAAVLKPRLDEPAGLVVSNGLAPQLSDHDAGTMALSAVDEAVRNAVCVGADPKSLTLLDNFCWPDPVDSPQNPDGKWRLAQLVETCQALASAVRAFGAPLISGKDSMKNNFDDGEVKLAVPPTLLVSAMGKIPDADKCVTMEFKKPGDLIYLVCAGGLGLAGSLVASVSDWSANSLPSLDLEAASLLYGQIHQCIMNDLVHSCHDVSEGGLGIALAECSIGSGLGARILTHRITQAAQAFADSPAFSSGESAAEISKRLDFALFAEGPGRLVVTIDPGHKDRFEAALADSFQIEIGKVTGEPELVFVDSDQNNVFDVSVSEMERAWSRILPFDEGGEGL